jgi:hypothetical protein
MQQVRDVYVRQHTRDTSNLLLQLLLYDATLLYCHCHCYSSLLPLQSLLLFSTTTATTTATLLPLLQQEWDSNTHITSEETHALTLSQLTMVPTSIVGLSAGMPITCMTSCNVCKVMSCAVVSNHTSHMLHRGVRCEVGE